MARIVGSRKAHREADPEGKKRGVLGLDDERGIKMENLVNLTPHALTVCGEDGSPVAEIPASGQIARVSTKSVGTGLSIAGRPVFRSETGSGTGVPEPEPGKVFIVSLFVLSACRDRTDVVAPDTGPTCVRTPDGKIIGVRQWIAN